ncbi:LPXTG-motif cell wall-anchored protein [Kitasatospora sp. GP30]|nr:LPXTG-motif cell wall-anchored protein [Kitasatospora sp. GP30]
MRVKARRAGPARPGGTSAGRLHPTHQRHQDLEGARRNDGSLQNLSQFPECSSLDEVNIDTSSLGQHLDNHGDGLFNFLVKLSPNTSASLSQLVVVTDGSADHTTTGGSSDLATLQVEHPDATEPSPAPGSGTGTGTGTGTGKPTTKPSGTPTAEPTESATPAAAPVAATPPAPNSAPTAEPSGTAAPDQRLAYTGGGDSSWTLVAAGSALLASGAAALAFARRRTARR